MKTKPFTPAQQVVVQPGTAVAVVSPRTPPCSAICPLPSALVPTARLRAGRHPCLGSSVGQVDGPARTPGLSTALLVFLPRLGDPSTGTCVRELGLGQHGLGVPSRAAGRARGPSCLPVLRCLVPGKLPALPPGPRPPARPTLAAVVDSAETAWLPTSSRVQSGRTVKTNMAAFVHTGLLCGGSHVHGDGVGGALLSAYFPPGAGVCHSFQTAEPIWVHVDLGLQGLCRRLGGRAVASLLGSVPGLPVGLVGVVRSFTE